MAWRVLRLRMEERPLIWRVAANILNKQSQTADRGWSSSLEFGRGANNCSLRKRILLQNIHRQRLRPGLILWYDQSSERGTWDLVLGMLGVLCRAGSLIAAARELARYKLVLVGVQEVRWDKGIVRCVSMSCFSEYLRGVAWFPT
jgi:hypothetical protein